jgi:glycine/D-amino acid oxidase-like deaminating enzyme
VLSLSAPQRRLRVGRPLWLPDAARAEQRYPVLTGRHDTAVAVVGGGMTGALVAHAFASAGIATTVLEAAVVGRGSTAASSALLLKEPDRELTELTHRYGCRSSRRIWELSHQSVDQLVALLKRLRIRCDLKIRDAVYYATNAQTACPRQRSLSGNSLDVRTDGIDGTSGRRSTRMMGLSSRQISGLQDPACVALSPRRGRGSISNGFR